MNLWKEKRLVLLLMMCFSLSQTTSVEAFWNALRRLSSTGPTMNPKHQQAPLPSTPSPVSTPLSSSQSPSPLTLSQASSPSTSPILASASTSGSTSEQISPLNSPQNNHSAAVNSFQLLPQPLTPSSLQSSSPTAVNQSLAKNISHTPHMDDVHVQQSQTRGRAQSCTERPIAKPLPPTPTPKGSNPARRNSLLGSLSDLHFAQTDASTKEIDEIENPASQITILLNQPNAKELFVVINYSYKDTLEILLQKIMKEAALDNIRLDKKALLYNTLNQELTEENWQKWKPTVNGNQVIPAIWSLGKPFSGDFWAKKTYDPSYERQEDLFELNKRIEKMLTATVRTIEGIINIEERDEESQRKIQNRFVSDAVRGNCSPLIDEFIQSLELRSDLLFVKNFMQSKYMSSTYKRRYKKPIEYVESKLEKRIAWFATLFPIMIEKQCIQCERICVQLWNNDNPAINKEKIDEFSKILYTRTPSDAPGANTEKIEKLLKILCTHTPSNDPAEEVEDCSAWVDIRIALWERMAQTVCESITKRYLLKNSPNFTEAKKCLAYFTTIFTNATMSTYTSFGETNALIHQGPKVSNIHSPKPLRTQASLPGLQ